MTDAIQSQPAGAPSPEPAALAHRRVLIAFSGLVLVMLLAALDSTIVSTALPTIVGELGGLEHLSWVVTGYLLAQTVVTPIYGKIGDLYGRKRVLQSAIVLFLVGSALCGLSRSMTTLIAFRAVQGLGGGGLNVTTQAVVGDIVTPRERGRYQGIFGAVFGLASIAGPLLGGYFTTHLSWRWIFYVNLPIGIAAMVVLAATLPAQMSHVRHAIDYAGSALLAVVLAALTLLADLGGTAVSWGSPTAIGLIAVSVVALVMFAVVERRAAEPVLPPRLFAQRTFSVSSAIGLIVGFALFGSVTYFPLYLQVVKGVSPTASGLEMLPMMAGMLVLSIVSGQTISRTGRYRYFPIVGMAVITVGLGLLSRLAPSSGAMVAAADILVLGVGLGMVMQVLVIAVQNAVDYADLGVATSGATLFRLVGGSLGTAVLGAVFASRVAGELARSGVGTGGGGAAGGAISSQALAAMPAAVRAAYGAAFTAALDTVFFVAALVALVGFVLAWLLPERPLRQTIAAGAGDAGREAAAAFARPLSPEVVAGQLYSALARLADRDVQRAHIEQIVQRAGESLTPAAAWLLVQSEREPAVDPYAAGRRARVPDDRVASALTELSARGLIAAHGGGGPQAPALTAAGCDVLERLVASRRAHLCDLAAEWEGAGAGTSDGGRDLATFLRESSERIVPTPHRPRAA